MKSCSSSTAGATPLGLLEREVCGPYEAPWDREEPHPLVVLHAMTEELDAMARVVVEQLMDEV
jgi:hypothetical protein